MIGFGLNIPAIAARVRPPVFERFLAGANRFQMGTDFGTGDTGLATAGQPWGGGNGTQSFGKYFFRRWRFTTGGWAPRGGVFAWTTDAFQAGYGVVRSLKGLTISRVEVRLAADASLVETVTFGGAGGYALAAGEAKASDPLTTTLSAGTGYFLDVYWTVAAGGAWPSMGLQYAIGEYSRGSTSIDFSATATPPANTGANWTGAGSFATFGPFGFFARGWDGSPVALIVGDSTEEDTNVIPALLDPRGDIGHIAQALGASMGGVFTYQETARFGAYINDLYTPANMPAGTTARPLFQWLAESLAVAIGQARAPWQLVVSCIGKNNPGLTTDTLADVQGRYAAAIAAARGYWPGIGWAQETLSPNTYQGNFVSGWTDEAAQAPYQAQMGVAPGGYLDTLNAWILAGGGGLFAASVDSASVLRGATRYDAWSAESWSGTLTTAVTANNAATVTVTADPGKGTPPIGATLTFEAGDAANYDYGYQVLSATAAGGNWTVALVDGRSFRFAASRKVAKAHAAGTAIRATKTGDGLHQSHKGSVDMAAVLVTRKANLAAIAAAYSA